MLQILYAYEDEMGEDVIASLDFWSAPVIAGAPQPRPGELRQIEQAR
jgi:hypothetical protein